MKAEKETEARRKAAAIAIAPSDPNQLDDLKAREPETYQDVLTSDVTRKQKYEKALPGFTASESFTPENIYLLESKPEMIQTITRLVMLGHESKAFDDLRDNLAKIIDHHQTTGLTPWLGSLSLEALKIRAYNALGIQDIITRFSAEPFTHDTKEIKQVLRKAKGKQVKDCLGIFPGKTPSRL